MGRIVKSPEPIQPPQLKSIFLAGGISNCADWQEPVAEALAEHTEALIYNPRRVDFDMSAHEEHSRAQIAWEYHALRLSTINLFWFPPETLCPITLFELGSALERMTPGTVMVGADPEYKRLFDVEFQMKLRHGLPVFTNINILVQEAIIRLNDMVDD